MAHSFLGKLLVESTLTMYWRKVTISRLNAKKITIYAELALICEINTVPQEFTFK
jgi:hypothetical protein